MALSPLVPDLDVVEPGRAPLDFSGAGGVEDWLDRDGTVYARCRADGDRYSVELPAVASFRFERRGARVVGAARPGVDARAVADAYWRDALPLVLHARGAEVLHASAVVARRGVIAFCGASGAGKSTLAYGLHRRGHALWADDVVALDVSPGNVTALPLPFGVRLRPSSAALFGVGSPAADDRRAAHVGTSSARALPLAAVCLLTPRSTGLARRDPAVLRRVAASAAYAGVLAHAFCFHLDDPDRKRAMLER